MYTQITSETLERLNAIVGAENVITDDENIEPYAHDEVGDIWHAPEAVAKVSTAAEVSEILELAQQAKFPVTPRGAGQGLSGGSVPIHGGLVLSLEKMTNILEIDHDNLMVTVEPGVITGDLHRAVEAEGLFYPPDPASLDSCSIGGNVAENAGGPRAIKYGVTNDYVCGLQAVLPSGEIIELGGKVVKNVSGYNLIQLLIGSEGTLAVITRILLRLLPLPKERIDLLVPFDDFDGAARSVSEVIKSKIVPTALEFMEQDSILAVEKLTEKEVPFHDAAAHLLITIDGNDSNSVEADAERVGEICLEHGARDVLVADTESLRDKLWGARRLIIEALQHLSPDRIMDTQDIVVPRSKIPELLARVKKISGGMNMQIISFGHAGDGNVHVNIIKEQPDAEWKEKVPQIAERIYEAALDLGGMITGEHGIGLTRKQYLSLGKDPAQVSLMKKIKDDFDPNTILNPGKIFA